MLIKYFLTLDIYLTFCDILGHRFGNNSETDYPNQMARIFGIGNKKRSGGSVPGGNKGVRNSETDSETLSAILDLNNRLKTRNIILRHDITFYNIT